MFFSNFVMVEREVDGSRCYYVTHIREPRFCVEVDPGFNPLEKNGGCFIKSIRINNSWTGDYHRCLSLVKQAEEFFRQSFLGKTHRQ